jgi:two-component system, chemotaxis family, chemotaxis protein CheY
MDLVQIDTHLTRPVNILIVDDSKTVHLMLENTISHVMKNVVILDAFDGKEAVDMVELSNIDIILLDWNMPEMTGIEALKVIRANPENKHIKIAMVTTEAQKDDVRKAISIGLNGYIVKPFDRAKVIAFLKQSIARIQ